MFCGAPSDCRSTASALLLCLQKSPDTHALLSYDQWKRTTHRITLFVFLAHWLQIKTTNFTFLSPFLNVQRFIYGYPFILVLNKNQLHINFNDKVDQRSKIVSIDFTNSQNAETQCLFEIGQHLKWGEHCNEAELGRFWKTHCWCIHVHSSNMSDVWLLRVTHDIFIAENGQMHIQLQATSMAALCLSLGLDFQTAYIWKTKSVTEIVIKYKWNATSSLTG